MSVEDVCREHCEVYRPEIAEFTSYMSAPECSLRLTWV